MGVESIVFPGRQSQPPSTPSPYWRKTGTYLLVNGSLFLARGCYGWAPMLTHLDIHDFAIIDHVALELQPGMTVLTGETGAGKSILGDALSLALGDRGSGNLVRPGAERAEISAAFDASTLPLVLSWLADQDLEQPDHECILRRSLSADGRSRSYVNGRPVPLQSLRELGGLLVDIHGQHAHQSLLRRDVQRQILDEYAGHEPRLEALARLHRRWLELQQEKSALGGSHDEREAELDLLRYQVAELQALSLSEGEMEQLDEEHARLSNAGRLLEGSQRALHSLAADEEESVLSRLEAVRRELDALRSVDETVGPIAELLENAAIQAREGAAELRHYAEAVDLDPEKLLQVEQRIAEIHDIARKHRRPPEELLGHLAVLERKLAHMERGDERRRELQDEERELVATYQELAQALHRSRLDAATRLEKTLVDNIHGLGMPGGEFSIQVNYRQKEQPSPAGSDGVEFLVSTNPGQPLRPLNKVASGGELSRISLAVQVIGVRGSGVPTLVFDEVDTGIGGGTAEVVGRQLKQLGEARQVLCITHLPQVASQGNNHLQVRKQTRDDMTFTRIAPLLGETRVEEIARMLGGMEITAHTMAHAREMIERGQGEAKGAGGRGRGAVGRNAGTGGTVTG